MLYDDLIYIGFFPAASCISTLRTASKNLRPTRNAHTSFIALCQTSLLPGWSRYEGKSEYKIESRRYPRTPGRPTLHFTQSGKTILIFKSGYENKMADNVHRNPVFVKALFVSDIKSIFI